MGLTGIDGVSNPGVSMQCLEWMHFNLNIQRLNWQHFLRNGCLIS